MSGVNYIAIDPSRIDKNGIVYLAVYEDVFGNRFFENEIYSEELGNWETIAQIGVQAFQVVSPMIFGQGGSGTQARGLAAINAAGQQLIAQMQQILSAVQANPSIAGQALQDARALEAALSNPQYFYQARRGRDAEALRNFKAQAAGIVRAIESLATSMATSMPTNFPVVNNQNIAASPFGGGQQTASALNANTILLFGGLGIAALLLLRQ